MKKVKGSLEGVDSNAFSILGYFRAEAKRQATHRSPKLNRRTLPRGDFPKDWIEAVTKEATSKDHNHLMATILTHMED